VGIRGATERVPQEVHEQYRPLRTTDHHLHLRQSARWEEITVVFKNNLTAALEQSEGTLDRAAQVKIVAVPSSFLN
jgi:hypothetical protein